MSKVTQEEFDRQYGPRLKKQYVDDSVMTDVIQSIGPVLIILAGVAAIIYGVVSLLF